MPIIEGTGLFRTPGRGPRWTDRESWWRRTFVPPSALGIVILAIAVGVVIGAVGAVIWASSDSVHLRTLPAPPPIDRRQADQALAAQQESSTTTTKPDLSADEISRKVGPLVWTVSTMDAAGQPVQASAFAAGSSGNRTFLLTSLAGVEAATRAPGPPITVHNGSFNGPATLWTWQENRDLALLVVDRATTAPLAWANGNPAAKPGDKIFGVGGVGGVHVTPGIVTAFSPTVVQHNVFVDDQLRGGPLVNVKGDVVAVASATFASGGQPTDTAFFGVPIQAACEAVLRCAGGGPGSTDAPVTVAPSPTTVPRPGPTTVARPGPTTATTRPKP